MQTQLRQAFKIKNICILISGLFFMAAGVSLSKIAGLGTSPIASIPNVLSLIFPISIGTLTILFMIVIVAIEPLFLRRDFSLLNLLQIIPGCLFGFFIDLFMQIFSFVSAQSYLIKLVLTLLSVVILAFGVYLEISSHSIVLPGEGLAKATSLGLKKPFSSTKIWVDSGMVLIALPISLIVFHSLTGIREGTILAALLVGKIVALFNYLK